MTIRSQLSAITIAITVALAGPVALGNLLVNGGFEEAEPCASGWTKTDETNNCVWDGTTHVMIPTHVEGDHWGSTDITVPAYQTKIAKIYQVVSVVPGLPVRLTGALAGGTQKPAYNHFVRLHNGVGVNAPVIASFEKKPYLISEWSFFDLTATPTSDQVTVSWGYDNGTVEYSGGYIVTTQVDDLSLTQQQPNCSGDPTITDFSRPGLAANNATWNNFQVFGRDYDSTCQVVLRRTGQLDVPATEESVNPEGTTITCNLPLNGVAMGKWKIVVLKNECNSATSSDDFIVANPNLTNGSFEFPYVFIPVCINPPTQQSSPTNWIQTGISTGTNHLIRDSNQFVPSCPRPDGSHYGSILVPSGTSFGHWRVYQYVKVTPGQQLTLSGQFAGGGRTTVRIRLRDGDENASELASRTIEDRIGCPEHAYNWLPASVTGTPTGELVTVEWILTLQSGTAASHADKLVLSAGPPPAEICGNGVDDDGDRAIDCQDTDCAAEPACSPPPVEICNNMIDDDGDLRIDCDDPDCASVCIEICGNAIDDDQDCQVDEGCEICDNGIDDNGDKLIDCDDPTCFNNPICPQEICDNGIDDDNDTLIDCADPNCKTHPHCLANDPFADTDNDGDVDQADFGVFQVCFTGMDNRPPAFGCGFFDRDNDADVDEQDFVMFQNCFSGPKIPANPACDD